MHDSGVIHSKVHPSVMKCPTSTLARDAQGFLYRPKSELNCSSRTLNPTYSSTAPCLPRKTHQSCSVQHAVGSLLASGVPRNPRPSYGLYTVTCTVMV